MHAGLLSICATNRSEFEFLSRSLSVLAGTLECRREQGPKGIG